ncbi:hypothetical protein GCM10010344_27050 [Streptomyces bluensis]|nr:hypothetical protein GCM10010344_27050 [Streptomyces bluensis]
MLCALRDDGATQAEAGGVAEVLDGGDLTQLFDDSGEHFPGPPASWGSDSGAVEDDRLSGLRHRERRRRGSALGTDHKQTAARTHARPPRTASHPDFNRRSRNFTWSTDRWKRPGRGL